MRTVEWAGEHAGSQWRSTANLRLRAGGAAGGSAFGHLSCAEYEVGWQLVARDGWLARSVDVRLVGSSNGRRLNRTLLLEYAAEEGWRSSAWCVDDAELPPPGLVAPADARSYRDVVIDACPLSHVPPIRRLGLLRANSGGRLSGRRAVAGIPALRVLLPSLAVVPTRQRYHWVADQPRAVRLRHAFAAEPPTDLIVDDQGVPVEFGGLSRRRDSSLVA